MKMVHRIKHKEYIFPQSKLSINMSTLLVFLKLIGTHFCKKNIDMTKYIKDMSTMITLGDHNSIRPSLAYSHSLKHTLLISGLNPASPEDVFFIAPIWMAFCTAELFYSQN